MKKTLLGLSLLPLVVLPIVGILSCSTTKDPSIIPTLETEADKFKNPVVAKNKDITAKIAAQQISDAITQQDKMIVLETIASTVPPLADGFVMTINSATSSIVTPTSLEVRITITETSTSKIKGVFLTVTSFKPILEWVAGLFTKTQVKKKDEIAFSVITSINDPSANQVTKLKILKTHVDFPPDFVPIETGFNIIIGEVKPVGQSLYDATAIQVPITLKEKDTNKEIDIVWKVEGFSPIINIYANLFNEPAKSIPSLLTPEEASQAINKAPNQVGKQLILEAFVKWPPQFFPDDWILIIDTARPKNNTEIQVHFTIDYKEPKSNIQKLRPKSIVWTITGFGPA